MKILSTDNYYFSCCNSMLIPNTQTANWQKKRISITEWETGRFREVCCWMLIFFNVKKKIRTNEQLNDLKYLVQTCFVTKFVYCRSFSSVSFRRYAFDYSTSSSLFCMCVCLSVFFFSCVFLFHLSQLIVSSLMLLFPLLLLLYVARLLNQIQIDWRKKQQCWIVYARTVRRPTLLSQFNRF